MNVLLLFVLLSLISLCFGDAAALTEEERAYFERQRKRREEAAQRGGAEHAATAQAEAMVDQLDRALKELEKEADKRDELKARAEKLQSAPPAAEVAVQTNRDAARAADVARTSSNDPNVLELTVHNFDQYLSKVENGGALWVQFYAAWYVVVFNCNRSRNSCCNLKV